MSDVLKTNELIEKLALAAEDAAGGPPSAEQVDALIDYSDALREALERSQRGGATLGEIIKQQCEDIVKITRSEDLILPDGDGDYETVWERAFKMRADLAALEAATRERDAAVAAIERVRDVAMKHRSVEQHNEMVPLTDIADLIREPSSADYLAALDGAPEPEDVWEYGYELIEPDDRNVFEREGDFISAAFAYRAAKKRIHEERHPDTPSLQYAIIRRIKAGPWEPVGGES